MNKVSSIKATPTGQRSRYIAPPLAGLTGGIVFGHVTPEKAEPKLPHKDRFTPLPGSNPVNLLERTGCAWPVGENPTLFCNCACVERPKRRPTDPVTYYPYCATHRQRSIQKGTPK